MTDDDVRDEADHSRISLSRRSAIAGSALAALGGLAGCADDGFVTPDGDGTDVTGGTPAPDVGQFEHEALGDATIEMGEGVIEVTGVESEGDGIATLLGQTVEWASDTGTTISNMAEGATLRATAIGNVAGEPDQMATTVTITREGERNVVDWDYPIANGNVAVEVLDEDDTVHFEEVGTDADLSFAPGGEVMDTHIWFLGYVDEGGFIQDQLNGIAPASCTYEFSDPSGGQLAVVLNGSQYTGTRLRVMEIPGEETADVWYTSEHRLTGSGVGTIRMNTETADPGVMFDGLSNEPVGDASLERRQGSVVLSGLEDRDGVLVELGEVVGVDTVLEATAPGEDAELLARGRGVVEDEDEGEVFGTAGVVGAGETMDLVADFEALGSDLVDVEVLSGDDLVDSVTVEGGTYGSVGVDVPVVASGIAPMNSPGLYQKFGDAVPITLGGNTELQGDEVCVSASEPDTQVAAVSEFEVLGSGLEGVAITGEQPRV